MGEILLYGLKNCSSCQKARAWLAGKEVKHTFFDYRDDPIDRALLEKWALNLGGWNNLINRSGPTWRNLSEGQKSPRSTDDWLELIREHPALIRRPLVIVNGTPVALGFKEKTFEALSL